MAIDDAAPVLQTATVDAHAITLTYDEPLYDSKPPPSTAFSVKVDGIASTIRSTQVNQLAVKLYLHDPVGAATVTLDYTVPPWNTGRIHDQSGNLAAALSDQAVTNNTADKTAPRASTVTVDGDTVTLTYAETLDQNRIPPKTTFAVKVGTSTHAIETVSVQQAVVTLDLETPVASGDTVTFDYAAPTSPAISKLQDPSGNAAVSLDDVTVTNNTADSGSSRSQEPDPLGIPQNLDVDLRQSGKLNATWDPPNTGPTPTGYTIQWKAAYDSWTDPDTVSQASLTKTSYVINGLTNGSEYAARVFATRDSSQGDPSDVATGTPQETTPPELSTASVREATLTLNFNEALDGTATPNKSAFTVNVDGSNREINAVSVSDATVTVTLSTSVASADAATVSYTVPADRSASRLQDIAGNAAASFNGQSVTNDTPAGPLHGQRPQRSFNPRWQHELHFRAAFQRNSQARIQLPHLARPRLHGD